MSKASPVPAAERAETNKSLEGERRHTDRALAAKQAAVEENADLVVERARETADAVLAEARDKADAAIEDVIRRPTSASAYDSLVEKRAVEDAVIVDERAAADEALRHEREANARTLAQLLPLEREKTDRFLLTERARSDDALANRDDFLGIVAHDLRNLLGGIVMSTVLFAEPNQEAKDGKRRIQRYAARMNRLIGDLVDVASIDAGKLAVTAVEGDLTALVAEAIETFQEAARAKRISLSTELDAPLLCDFDHVRLLQVLANLVTNAIKFTEEGGSVVLRAMRDGETVRASVADDGIGIPEHMLEVVFRRFWQARGNDPRGLGLGLYISRSIIEQHGGNIWAERREGKGSNFIFTLPVHRTPPPPRA